MATDLDGTLLRPDASLSDRTRAALRAVRTAGARVVVVTARPARVMNEIFGAEPLVDIALCGNGAVRYDARDRGLIITHRVPRAVASRVMAEVSRRVPGAGFAIETGHRVLFESGYRYQTTHDNDRLLVDAPGDLLAEGVVKLLVWLPDGDPAAAWALLRSRLRRLVTCTWSGVAGPLEIAATGVSKAAALATLCREWNVRAAEVVAFGDAPNDLSMLAWAGTSCAVANAHPEVLLRATHRAAANDEDGVAQVLERLFARS